MNPTRIQLETGITLLDNGNNILDEGDVFFASSNVQDETNPRLSYSQYRLLPTADNELTRAIATSNISKPLNSARLFEAAHEARTAQLANAQRDPQTELADIAIEALDIYTALNSYQNSNSNPEIPVELQNDYSIRSEQLNALIRQAEALPRELHGVQNLRNTLQGFRNALDAKSLQNQINLARADLGLYLNSLGHEAGDEAFIARISERLTALQTNLQQKASAYPNEVRFRELLRQVNELMNTHQNRLHLAQLRIQPRSSSNPSLADVSSAASRFLTALATLQEPGNNVFSDTIAQSLVAFFNPALTQLEAQQQAVSEPLTTLGFLLMPHTVAYSILDYLSGSN